LPLAPQVYVVYFKTNARWIRDYPAISNYVQELYAMPGLQHATNIGHIKTHYFTSHPHLNTYAVIPLGGEPWWEQPHDRTSNFP
jgi:putative glutathione S-transferase